MKISICVPVYGVEKYIARCAVSLFEQSYKDIEYVFVNDCTKDRSIDILNNVIEKYPFRKKNIKIVSHDHNRGLSAARNTGVANATGLFLMHVDSDDYIEKDAVRLLVEKQKEGNYDIVFSYANRYHSRYVDVIKYPLSLSSHEMTIKFLKREIDCYVWGKLIRKSLYSDNNIHAIEGLNSGEDFQVITLLTLHSKSIIVVPEILYHYSFDNIYSESSQKGVWKSEEYDKSSDYVYKKVLEKYDRDFAEAIIIGKLRTIVSKQLNVAHRGYRDYYDIILSRKKQINKKYYKYVNWKYKLPLYINNYYLIKFYYFIFSKINKVYKIICN